MVLLLFYFHSDYCYYRQIIIIIIIIIITGGIGKEWIRNHSRLAERMIAAKKGEHSRKQFLDSIKDILCASSVGSGARFSKGPETFRVRKAIFRSSECKNGDVYTPETSCTK